MSGQATVITPPSWGSRAIELGSRRWSKRVLPVGSVEYKGRQLHFTPDYISSLVEAWHDRAYDQVPLQLADSGNQHTNDPERTRGWVTGMEAREDGLWVTAELTPAGEAVISENPMLGVSCRIVENYDRSDGRHYPAAVQHILGTLDPRIPQLGSWQPTDLSNGGELIIDLSQASWHGEPGPSWDLAMAAVGARLGSADPAGLTPRELAELDQVLAEADAEEDAAGYSALAEFDGTFTETYQAEARRDQARQAADLDDLVSPAVRDEDILSRAIARASAGIYDTSRVTSLSNEDRAIDLTAQTGQGLCGDPDPFGRCSARYHDLQCIHGIGTDWQASEPPSSTYATALSNFAGAHDTGPEPASYGGHPYPQRVTELASALNESWGLHTGSGHVSPEPDISDLLGPSYGVRQDPYAAMAAELGLAGEQPAFRDYPDVSAIRAGLGI